MSDYKEHDNFEHSGYTLSESFKTKPYDYQVDAIVHLTKILKEHGFAGLFAEVGTGKTKIALDTWSYNKSRMNHLVIVCPKSLISTWIKQINVHTDIPESRIFRWDKLSKTRNGHSTLELLHTISQFVFLINVEAFQFENTLVDKLMLNLAKNPGFMVIDESVKIKEPSAKRTKRLIKYGKLFAYKMIMTGTEISAGPQSLYSQFRFLQDKFWIGNGISNYGSYKGVYCIEKQIRINGGRMVSALKNQNELTDMERLQFNNRLKALHNVVDPYIHRILRKDCLSLPDRIETDIIVTMSDEEKRAYNAMKRDSIVFFNSESFTAAAAIAQFTKLRQITGGHIEGKNFVDRSSKLSWLINDVEDNDENAIVVCFFQRDVENVYDALCKEGYSCRSYYGGNPDDVNDSGKSDFESGKVRFLVASHEMIAQGHNLQEHCALMYIYSVSLNSEVNAQYKGRIDRNGQTRNPVYKFLLAEDTIDEHIHRLIESKMNVQKYFSEIGREEAAKII